MTPLDGAFLTQAIFIPAGDSFTVGLANVGTSANCRQQPGSCSPGNLNCQIPVQTENAAISWGPLTAANFTADYQVIAWSGAGLITELAVAGNPDLPLELARDVSPSDVELYGRQVAGDNTSVVTNQSTWVPQVVSLLCP